MPFRPHHTILTGLATLVLGNCAATTPPVTEKTAGEVAGVQLVEAAATLDRVAPPEEGVRLQDEVFMLTTLCTIRVTNSSPVPVLVSSLYGSPFDDFRLVISDENGSKLATTSHIVLEEPAAQAEVHALPKGESVINLICLVPIANRAPAKNVPFIPSNRLTSKLKVHFEGGFPGSKLLGKIRSNTVDVAIIDRTGGIPDDRLTIDPSHQAAVDFL